MPSFGRKGENVCPIFAAMDTQIQIISEESRMNYQPKELNNIMTACVQTPHTQIWFPFAIHSVTIV